MEIICDITDTTLVQTEGLGFNKELCEDEYTSDQYIPGTTYSILTTDLQNTFRNTMYVRFLIANNLECLNPVSLLPVTVLSKLNSLKKTNLTTNALESLLLERILKSPLYNENKVLLFLIDGSKSILLMMMMREKRKDEQANIFGTKYTEPLMPLSPSVSL